MIELTAWIRSTSFAEKPWLILGKGPTFAKRSEFDLSRFHKMSLNHAVREVKVDVAHIIDVDVVTQCADVLLENCDWLILPRRPHVNFDPGKLLLEDYVERIPVLREFDSRGRLVWYNLSSGEPVGDSPIVRARFFSSEAALGILVKMGVKEVRSLGVDGGRHYSKCFEDLEETTKLANGQPSFDLQLQEIESIVKENSLDYAPLVEPIRVFVGTDDSQIVATRVLEYSIRKHATRPVEFYPMKDMTTRLPKDKKNRPRTGFSFYRFLIPKLCKYRGRAIYMDADMHVFADMSELMEIDFGNEKVLCTFQERAPEAWKDSNFFHLGRQMSVMMLDCSRLQWDIDQIISGLDEGEYDYKQLMFHLCLVRPEEISDRIPPEWNCLEHYSEGETKNLHYTVVPTQPWKNDENPLREIWEAEYREAVAAGAVPPNEVLKAIEDGHVKSSLADGLSSAPKTATFTASPPLTSMDEDTPASERVRKLERELASANRQVRELADTVEGLLKSRTWRVGRSVVAPLVWMRDLIRSGKTNTHRN